MGLDHVVFGGGGMHGIMYLGALIGFVNNSQARYEAWRAQLKSVAGTSVGALVGFLITRWDPWQILEFVKTAGFKELDQMLFDQNWKTLCMEMSVNSGRQLNKLIKKGMLESTGSEDTTFREAYAQSGIHFIVTVTNSQTGGTHYWSHANMPDLPVWKALRASVSIPYVFPEFVIGNGRYIDGGVTCNIPCHLFPAYRTLVLYVQIRKKRSLTPGTLLDWYSNSAQLGCFRAKPLYALNSIPCVPGVNSVSQYNFGASSEDMDDLVLQGLRCWRAMQTRNFMLVHLVMVAQWLHQKPSLPSVSFSEAVQ
jgi:predicted acylesterase/phospholipase RssA